MAELARISPKVECPYSYFLAAVQGWDWLSKTVRLESVNEHVLRVIAEVINRRLKEIGQPIAKSA